MVRVDKRSKDKRKIWEEELSITIADSQNSGFTTIVLNGIMDRLVMTLPDLDTDTRAVLTIDNSYGEEIYNSSPRRDNQATALSVEGAVCGLLTFTITCTTQQAGDKACTVIVTMREP